jgi:carboxyl-terminal processing protease
MRLFYALILCGLYRTTAAQDDFCQAGLEYDRLTSTVTEQFYDKTFNGLDWNERVAHYRSRIACTDDEVAVSAVVNELLSELMVSHTVVYTPADLDYWGINSLFSSNLDEYQINFSGIWPEQIEGKWYARFVFEESPAQRAGILPGDELVALNGAPFAPLGFSDGESVLTISSDGHIRKDVPILTQTLSVMHAIVNAALASAQILEHGGKKVGWFRLWTARDAILGGLNSALEEFERMNVDALVIDLRGPYGGTGEQYLARIREREYLKGIPKFFLIDDSSRSGKEWLSSLIRRDNLGTLVGTTTAGAYLAGRKNSLFDDRYFLYVAVQEAADTGVPIEGIGVSPHVIVEPCRMYCGGRDLILEKALELINPSG